MDYRVDGFRKFNVWQKAHQVFLEVTKDIEKFPKTRAAFMITDQVLRSTGGVSSGISEGYGAGKGNEFPYRLMVSRKECSETVDWLIKAHDLGYISSDKLEYYIRNLEEIRKMLNSLAGRLREHTKRAKEG